MQWGPHLEGLQLISDTMEEPLRVIREKPEIDPHVIPFWLAYWDLAATRVGSEPITFPDLMAYLQVTCADDEEDRMEYAFFVIGMDRAFLRKIRAEVIQ